MRQCEWGSILGLSSELEGGPQHSMVIPSLTPFLHGHTASIHPSSSPPSPPHRYPRPI